MSTHPSHAGRRRVSLPTAAAATVVLTAIALGVAAVRVQAKPTAAASAESSAATARLVTVTAKDYAFIAADTLLAGRTELRLVNEGAELHHAQLVHLAEGKRLSDLMQAMQAGGPPPKWAHELGGPNAPAPGQSSAVIVDLEPGTYVFLCFIPSPDGKPHVMKGMMKEFTVVAAPASAATPATPAAATSTRPEPSATMTLHDYGFKLSAPLVRGSQVLRVRNEAVQPHEVLIVRLAPGKSAHDFVGWVEKMAGPPPALPLGGTVAMIQGVSNDVVLDLEPGEYALICFIPDAKDGKPHFAHGMVQQITVK